MPDQYTIIIEAGTPALVVKAIGTLTEQLAEQDSDPMEFRFYPPERSKYDPENGPMIVGHGRNCERTTFGFYEEFILVPCPNPDGTTTPTLISSEAYLDGSVTSDLLLANNYYELRPVPTEGAN